MWETTLYCWVALKGGYLFVQLILYSSSIISIIVIIHHVVPFIYGQFVGSTNYTGWSPELCFSIFFLRIFKRIALGASKSLDQYDLIGLIFVCLPSYIQWLRCRGRSTVGGSKSSLLFTSDHMSPWHKIQTEFEWVCVSYLIYLGFTMGWFHMDGDCMSWMAEMAYKTTFGDHWEPENTLWACKSIVMHVLGYCSAPS